MRGGPLRELDARMLGLHGLPISKGSRLSGALRQSVRLRMPKIPQMLANVATVGVASRLKMQSGIHSRMNAMRGRELKGVLHVCREKGNSQKWVSCDRGRAA